MAGLLVEVGSDVSDAVAGLGDVGAAAGGSAAEMTDLGREAEQSARKLGVSADAADDFAGKAGKTTGALGALSSGFELVGLGDFAAGLQAASMATDFMSGAGDALNLVMESTAVKTIAAKAAAVASTVATGAQTAAQWALNAAMSANPIALVVIAVVALVAGFVLLYKKSETFRNLISDIGSVGKNAIGAIVSAVQNVIKWIGEKLPNAWNTAKGLIVAYLTLITTPIRTVYNVVKNIATFVTTNLPNAFGALKDFVLGIADKLLSPFKAVYDKIKAILSLIPKIHLPEASEDHWSPSNIIPNLVDNLNPTNRMVGRSSDVRAIAVTGGGDTYNFYGAVTDNAGLVKVLRTESARRDRRFGLAPA